MVDQNGWNKIVTYHCIPTEITGIFWMPSNKIYIYGLVKNYKTFHKYILDHEKKHYENYNCNKYIAIKIILDIWNEWQGAWKNTFNEELIRDKEKYMEELSSKNIALIKDRFILMERLNEVKATKIILRYSNIVWCFRPYQPCSFLLIILPGLLLFIIMKLISFVFT